MKHILIVDDVTTNLKCAVEVLKENYMVSTAKSGEQAFLILEKEIPDLILLDIDMPEMTGYEMLEQLKAQERFKDIPVVFLTAGADKESEIRGLKLGAMDSLQKPFDPDVMNSRISRILQITEQRKGLHDTSQKDKLTDLMNKKYMENLLDQTDEREEDGYFLLLDLDNLKSVNDRFGHAVGDETIVRFASVLRKEIGDDGSICRLGGDEFGIYLSGDFDEKKIREITCRLITEIEIELNKHLDAETEFRVSASIGISKKPLDGIGFNELYTAADKALYYVKQSGKRGFHFFSEARKSKEREHSGEKAG